jgi:hypothetical protein
MPGSRGVPAIGHFEDWSLVLPDLAKKMQEGGITALDPETLKKIQEGRITGIKQINEILKHYEDGRAESTAPFQE